MEAPHFLAIVGPTASGKTGLSLEVGRILDGEVVSMDSRQVYRGMDVGTGKVTLEERARLPHHGLDQRDPDELYSAGQFARDAGEWVVAIRGRRRVPVLVGGTGFFLRALIQPMFPEPGMDKERLEALRVYPVLLLDGRRAMLTMQPIGSRHLSWEYATIGWGTSGAAAFVCLALIAGAIAVLE